MKHTFAVLRQLLISYFAAAMAYRWDFLQSTFSSLMWSGLSFVGVLLVTSRTPEVAGMGRSDLLLLAATYGIIVGTHHLLCSRGFGGFSEIIHRGELDGYLLKPFDTVTLLSLRNIGWGSSLRVVGSVLLTWWLLHYYSIPVSLGSVLAFIGLSVFSFFLVYSFFTIACTVLIWHPYLSNVIDFVQNSVGTSRYPLDISNYVPKITVLYYLPFLLIVSIPTRALIGRLQTWDAAILMATSLGFFLFSRWFWRFALRHYTGASG